MSRTHKGVGWTKVAETAHAPALSVAKHTTRIACQHVAAPAAVVVAVVVAVFVAPPPPPLLLPLLLPPLLLLLLLLKWKKFHFA